ncbi:SusC/RagA family TonB-linked outer membrane protein [Leeuwenhoekiella blandensis]|uniref:SusC/RagA family TonB-linked outer membrane protein n=1 Tax=Leeuwenhoekiella blandensis TaxID=360293 RepID=UPI00235661FC|nr:SusC/RagA family TonB-linked outer membrane protein [Leeuwenhoekiella blandensis]|tara:strand:- start:15498 stop:18491 length:2994 start_codon:yes stop_codon:yes gene_type:complete
MKILTTRLTGAAWILVILFWTTGNLLWATTPQQTVSGTISDTQENPIPGVSIRLLNSNTGTQTDLDGAFGIQAQPSDTLSISYLGFKTLRLPVGNQTTFTITLQQDITDLGEVTINAGYYNTTRREQTGSIARVTAEEIEGQPVTNPLAALQGRMAGVNITQTTGVPGGGFNIQIRGTNSIGEGNDPLYIVDGVPFSSTSLGNETLSYIYPGTNSPLNSINPADIASIEILKDADATAIYGSRGANGVVLITTKKGKAGKTQLSLDLYSGIGEVAHFTPLMNTEQYLEMRREAYTNDGVTTLPFNAYDVNGTWDTTRNANWQELLAGDQARQQQLNLRFSGGTNQTRYLLGGTLRDETTVFPGANGYHKASVLASLQHKDTEERFALNLSVNYVIDRNDQPGSDLFSYTRTLVPNAPELYTEDGELNWENSTWANPLATYLNERYESKTYNLIANANLSYKLLDQLQLKLNLGYTTLELDETRILPSTRYNPAFNLDSSLSSVYDNNGTRKSWIAEPQLMYEHEIGLLEINALVGASFQEDDTKMRTFYAQNFPSNALLDDLAAASVLQLVKSEDETYRYQAVFGRINLNWDRKYLLNITGRRDGSSRFGNSNRFANFGAVGLAWIFTEEALFKNQSLLSFGKLRASYGITGNDQIGNYEYLDTYSLSNTNYDGLIGLAPTQLFNPNFSWETNTKQELALELGFFKDHLFLNTTYFKNRSGNQLVGIPLPTTTGFNTLRANLDATVENRGLEFELRSVNLNTTNWKWTTSFNLSIPKNELVSYPGLAGSPYANQLVIGESLTIQKRYEISGVNPDTGIYEFRDFDGDGNITATGDKEFIARVDPRYFGGLGNELSYKNWDLNFFFQFVAKDNTGIYSGIPGGMVNQPVAVTDRWQEPGDVATFQQYSIGRNRAVADAYRRFLDSNLNWSDASFIRLKNVNLNYTLPRKLLKYLEARLYLQGQNVFTLTDYTGADPETSSPLILPPLRQFVLGAQFTF